MKKVNLDDLIGLSAYEKVRDDYRRSIITLKKNRRVSVGDRVTFVFESFDTVRFQVQEMLRAEHITDLDRVREELAVYNELIPREGELSSTMLIEITEEKEIRPELLRLIGIDRAVRISFAGHDVPGVFEGGRMREDKLSAVQYVRFPFEEAARRAFERDDVPADLVIDHPNYRVRAPIEGAVRDSLRADLA